MALVTHQQVIDRLGGDEAAAQLLDPHRTGTYDTDVLDGAITDAEGDVQAAVGSRFMAYSATNLPPAKIQRILLQLAVYYCWQRGARNMAIPQNVVAMKIDARADLEKLEASESGPGGTPVSRFSGRVDNSFGGRRAVYSTWRSGGINGGRGGY
jgi:phage gp36-like protein